MYFVAKWLDVSRIKMPFGAEVGLGPDDIVLDGASAPRKRAQQPATFRPMSTVAQRSPISATAELLFVFSFFITVFVYWFRAAD